MAKQIVNEIAICLFEQGFFPKITKVWNKYIDLESPCRKWFWFSLFKISIKNEILPEAEDIVEKEKIK